METRFTLQEGNPNETYFARVRAVSQNGIGEYSNTLNTTTGRADFPHLVPGAATDPLIAVVTSFDPTAVSTSPSFGPTEAIWAETQKETIEGSLLDVRLTFQMEWASTISDPTDLVLVRSQLRIDGVVIDSAPNSIPSTGIGLATVPGLGKPFIVSEGTHEVDLRVELDIGTSPNVLTITPVQVILSLMEVRR